MFKAIDIETTERCNRRCGYCPNSTHYRIRREGGPQLMPDKMIYRIVSQLAELDYRGKVFLNMYGEPLGDPRILPIAHGVAKNVRGSRVVIYTNGDRLDHRTAVRLKSVPRLSVVITEHVPSVHGPRLQDLATRLGFKYRKFSEETGVLHNRCGLVDHPLAMGRAEVCFPGASPHMYINARGEAQLCCNDYKAEVTYGNVLDRTLLEIWNDPIYAEHRRKLPDPGLDICRRCNCNMEH